MGEILRNTDVVLATATGAGDYNLRQFNDFDWVVIDEAAQGLEAACWIAIQKGKRVYLSSVPIVSFVLFCPLVLYYLLSSPFFSPFTHKM